MKFQHVIIFSILLIISIMQSCSEAEQTASEDTQETVTEEVKKETSAAEEDGSFSYEFSKQATFFSDLGSGKVIDSLGMNTDQLETAHEIAMKKQNGNEYYMSIDGKVITGDNEQPKIWTKEKGERSFSAKSGEQVLYPITENSIYFFAPPNTNNSALTIKYMK